MSDHKEDYFLQVFDGTHYEKWKFRLKVFLEMKNCLEVIEFAKKPENVTDNDWQKMEVRAKNYIVNGVNNTQLEMIISENTARKMILKFDTIYSPKSSTSRLLCKRRLLDLKLKENENPIDFLNLFEKQINELKNAGEDLKEEDKLNYLLLCLPDSYSNIVDIIDALPEKDRTVEYVKSKLLLEQKKKESVNTDSNSQSFNVNTGRNRQNQNQVSNPVVCYRCNQVGHIQRNCQMRNNYENTNINPMNNYYRGNSTYRGRNNYHRGHQRGNFNQQRGHHQRGSSSRGRSVHQGNRIAGTSMVNNKSENSFNAEVMTSTTDHAIQGELGNDEVKWLLDSGCSDHVINNDKYFCEYTELKTPVEIKVGDGFSLTASKIGNISLYFYVKGNWIKTVIRNVYYVPNMHRNLLSVSSIVKQNNVVIFSNNSAKIYNPKNDLIAIATCKCKLFELIGKIDYCNSKSYTTHVLTDKEKWHKMLGHTNFHNLKEMCKLGALKGLPEKFDNESYVQCEICLKNKMTNLPFHNNRRRANDILEIIHTDVCGPLNPTSYKGERYFVSFIDDYSKIAQVFCIKHKNEVFSCFVEYVKRVQNITGKRVKEVRCDNGKEYLNKDFFNFVKQEGIYLKPAPAYTHELNGVAERYNRTIMERARCLLSEAEIDKSYWPECITAAAYLGNRLLTNVSLKKTPYEIFFNEKPDASNLQLYGSQVYVRIPDERRSSKLNPKAVKGILVGYTDMGYKILIENKVIISRHVKFINKTTTWIKVNEDEEEGSESEMENKSKESDEEILHKRNPNCEEEKSSKSKEVDEIVRPRRQRKIPPKFNDYEVYVNYCNIQIPNTYEEAIQSNNSKKWNKAMNDEIKSLEENKTWKIVNKPEDKKIVEVKWIYRIKSNGIYKARVVAKGFQQLYEENEEIYSPVARMTTLKVLLSTACVKNWQIEQMDVETAFLNGQIKSEVYIYPPDGYDVQPNKVCLLKKSLYGLRESPRDWYECFHDFMVNMKFERSSYDYCLYRRNVNNNKIYIILYVDDLLIFSDKNAAIKEIKGKLNKRFKMKDLGKVKQYLGIDIEYLPEKRSMFLSQESYIKTVAEKFNVTDSKPVSTPMELNLKLEPAEVENSSLKYRNLIGALLYIANGTRPDISFAVNYLSRYQNCFSDTHYKYALRVLKYLYHTRFLKLNYNGNYDEVIDAYVDADWAADIIDRKSTTGILVRVFGNPVMWRSQKQKIVSRASTHAEFYALANCVEEVLPIKGVLCDLGVNVLNPVNVYEDNSGAIALAKNGKFCKNSKHIDISYHFVHDFEKKGIINVVKISTDEQLADILTKSLGKLKFQTFRMLLNVIEKLDD